MEKKDKDKKFTRKYIECIVELIEDKPLFSISLSICKAIIFLSYFQIGAYLLQESSQKKIYDLKMKSICQIGSMLSLNEILILQNSSPVSLVCLIISQIFLYFYFIYPLILILFKTRFPNQFFSFKIYFQQINGILNLYSSLFISVILNYQVELLSTITFCSPHALFYKDRIENGSQCNTPIWQVLIGVLGLIVCLLTGIFCLQFVRSFEFSEENIIKRKVSNVFKIGTILKVGITLLEHSNIDEDSKLILKYVLIFIYAIISLFDATYYTPYQNQHLALFNIQACSAFLCVTSLFYLQRYTDSIQENELFYFTILIIVIISSFFQSVFSHTYEVRMQTDIYNEASSNKKSTFGLFAFDFYIQQFVYMGKQSQIDQMSSYKLLRILSIHVSVCRQDSCACRKLKKIEVSERNSTISSKEDQEINISIVYNIADFLYSWLLQQKAIYENSKVYELLSLQYITFMIKCLKNFTKANYQLKVLIQRRQQRGGQFSIYFQIISTILTKRMEEEIQSMNENYLASKRREQLTIKHLVAAENLCSEFIPIFQEVIQMKQTMWTKMQNGFTNMNMLQKEALKLMKFISKVKLDYLRKLKRAQNDIDLNYTLVIKKLSMLFYLFILNDSIRAEFLEDEVVELRKRDTFVEDDCLNNENLIKKNIVTLTISISKNIGSIVSKKDIKTAEFFGYSAQEFQRIKKIDELMPPFISQNHDKFLTSFISRGSSKYIKSSLFTFFRSNRGYINAIQLHPDFSFLSLDDFYLSGTMLKVNKNSEYLLFDQTGKILGISEKFAEKLLIEPNIMQHLPIAESIVKQFNAFTLIPSILKKIYKKKNEILLNFQEQRYEIVNTDDKGSLNFSSNLIQDLKEFDNFLNKLSTDQVQKGKGLKKDPKKQNKVTINNLDIFNSESYLLYKQFKKYRENPDFFDLDNNKSMRSFGNKTSVSQSTKTQGTSQTVKKLYKRENQKQKQEYKMKFKYVLSYHTLPQLNYDNSNNQQDQSRLENINTRNLFFSLEIKDILLLKNDAQIKKITNFKFKEQVAKYLQTMSCIPALNNLMQPMLGNEESDSCIDQQNEDQLTNKNQVDQQINKNYAPSHKLFSIPKSFINYLTKDNQLNNEIDKNEKTKKKSNKIDSSQQQSHDGKNQESAMVSSSDSDSQSDVFSETDSQIYSIGEDIHNNVNYNIVDSINQVTKINKKNVNIQIKQKVAKVFEDICDTELDHIFYRKQITTYDMLTVDCNYKAKRVILEKTHASKFITALQTAIADALIEQKEESQIKNNLLIDSDSENLKNITSNSGQQSEDDYQITFRKSTSQKNQFVKQKSSLSSQPKNNFQKQLSEDFEYKQQKQQNGISSMVEIQEQKQINEYPIKIINELQQYQQQNNQQHVQQDQNNPLTTIQDLSYRPSQINISYENICSQNLNKQGSSYFTASARPLFLKPLDLNNDLNNEILATPSSVDNDEQHSAKKQIRFQNQNNLLQSNASLDIRKSMGKKYNNQNSSQSFDNKNLSTPKQNMMGHTSKFSQSQKQINQLYYNESSQEQRLSAMMKDPTQYSDSNTQNQLNRNKTNKTENTHEMVINNLLNQGGLIDGKGEKISIHSSSKSSSSYGGYFLKEIMKENKIPSGAKTFTLFLVIFSLLFIGLNFANLMIIKSDMEFFSANSIVLRYPRRLLRSYAKTIYAQYLQIQIEFSYFKDTQDEEYSKLSDLYIEDGVTEYTSLIETEQKIIMEYILKYQQYTGIEFQEYKYYQDFQLSQETINTALILKNPLYFLIGSQYNGQLQTQISSFMTLRSNFFQYGAFIKDFIEYLVNNILTTAENLIIKFTFIGIGAILSVIIIPLFAIPAVKNINIYEEKILMIVSRINYDHSAIERQKLSMCSQLLNLDDYEWLKYQFSEVFCLRFDQFDLSVVNSNFQIQQLQSTHKYDKEVKKNKLSLSQKSFVSRNQLNSTQIINESDSKQKLPSQSYNLYPIKNNMNGKSKAFNIKQTRNMKKQHRDSNNSNQQSGKNYVLQSKIFDQRLSVFERMKYLLLFSFISVGYFLVVIIYLNANTDLLKTPVQINRQTNFIHAYYANYILSSEFLAFDDYVKKKWPKYLIDDLSSFYSQMKENIKQINQNQNDLTNQIYGSNPYSSDIVLIMKNLMEGKVCSYLEKNKCSGNNNNQQTSYGINQAVSELNKIQTSFPHVLNPLATKEEDLISYLNSDDRINIFVKGFKIQDEVFDVFSSTANSSIVSVSLQIQDLIENYLLICGISLAIIMIIVFIWCQKNLYRDILLMNFFLTFIPEEKLLEEVTLHMLKTLLRM